MLWTPRDVVTYYSVQTIEELGQLGVVIARRMRQPLGQVCGPITSGGSGNVTENIRTINEWVNCLESKGLPIFNQLNFHSAIVRLHREGKLPDMGEQLLNGFFLPLFENRILQKVLFVPNWQGSFGTAWERKKAAEFGIDIIDLPASMNITAATMLRW
jgi:hypothetical protein